MPYMDGMGMEFIPNQSELSFTHLGTALSFPVSIILE